MIFSGSEEQGIDRDGCVGSEVQPEAWIVKGVGLEFVELFVFLVGDIAFAFEPERLHGFKLVTIDLDRELHEAGVAFDDAFEFILLGKLLILILEGEDDSCAAAFTFDLLDLVSAIAVAGPAEAVAFELPGAGVDLNGIGDHEDRVEAHAELADQVFVALAACFEGVEEGFGAGVCDSAEVLDELAVRHADTEILDRDGASFFVGGDLDL